MKRVNNPKDEAILERKRVSAARFMRDRNLQRIDGVDMHDALSLYEERAAYASKEAGDADLSNIYPGSR